MNAVKSNTNFYMNIRVTKEFDFEMAHALLNYDGPCKNIHGHSYQLSVTMKGHPDNDNYSSAIGMVMDFSKIKEIVKREVIQPFDHALVLNKDTSAFLINGLTEQKLILVDFQPTCENLLIHFMQKLIKCTPPAIMLHHLLLRETATSYAEWYAEDNQ